MNKSTYKRWMKESFLYEADDDAGKHEDGDTWTTASGKYAGKHKGEVDYFEDKEDASDYAKHGASGMPDDDEDDKEKKTPVSIDIDASGGLGGDEEEYVGQHSMGEFEAIKNQMKNNEKEIKFHAKNLKQSEQELKKAKKSGDENEIVAAKEQMKMDKWNLNNHQEEYDELKQEYEDHPASKTDKTGTEEIKVINGKKYKPIKESVNKRISVKEVHKWLKGLEEYRYRRVPGVDARRITSFVNNGLSETDLPVSLQKKWESAKYSKEKTLADRFMKERINKKLTQTESKHPIKEQYNRLFKNKVVL